MESKVWNQVCDQVEERQLRAGAVSAAMPLYSKPTTCNLYTKTNMKKSLLVLISLASFTQVTLAKPNIFRPKPKPAVTERKPLFSKLKLGGLTGRSKISGIASRDVGTFYRRGVGLQCANYVSHVVERAGGTPPSNKASARSWLKWGKKVPRSNLLPGDIIVTSRGSSSKSGHILIYKGNGKAIHRSTRYKPICEISIDYYSSRILGIRRIS